MLSAMTRPMLQKAVEVGAEVIAANPYKDP